MSMLSDWTRARPLTAFVLLMFGWSWGLGLVDWAWQPGQGLAATLLEYLPKYGPSLAGVFVVAALEGRRGPLRLLEAVTRWRVAPVWYLIALGLVPSLILLGLFIDRALGGAWPQTVRPFPWGLGISLLATRFFFGGGLGEELGLRGLALPRLQARMAPWLATLVLALVWWLWHLPVYIGPPLAREQRGGLADFVLFGLVVLGLTVIFTWLYNATRGNLLLAALFHAATNGALSFAVQLWPERSDRAALLPLALLLLLGAWLMVKTRGQLAAKKPGTPPASDARSAG